MRSKPEDRAQKMYENLGIDQINNSEELRQSVMNALLLLEVRRGGNQQRNIFAVACLILALALGWTWLKAPSVKCQSRAFPTEQGKIFLNTTLSTTLY
jgi:hypothetical protein